MSEEDSLVDLDEALFVDVDDDSDGDGAQLSLQDQAREKGASEKEVRALRRDVARLRIESLPTFTQRASTEVLLELWSLAVNREEDWGEVEPAFHTARVRLAAALHDRSGVDVDQTTPTEEDSPTTISVPMGSVTKYASVFAFVRAWVAPTFARHDLDVAGQNFKWCSQWFSHPEAVFGFSEAWRHYEALNATGEAMDDWLVQVFYPLLDRLTSPSGTFAKCKHDHSLPDPLPVDSGEQEDPAPHAP